MPVVIEGHEQLIARLREKIAGVEKGGVPEVVTGYTAEYALYVHENMEIWPPGMRLKGQPRPGGRGMYWDPQGRAQPKFLETPLREKRSELTAIVVTAMRQGKTLTQALLLAGLRLQRESQQLVPVDFGELKASAFTRVESGDASSGMTGTGEGQ